MISTGPNSAKNSFNFMSNFWSGSSNSLPSAAGAFSLPSARSAFQHRPLKSASEESLNLDLLSNQTTHGKEVTVREQQHREIALEEQKKKIQQPRAKLIELRKRYKSQSDADIVIEHEFALTDEKVKNSLNDSEDEFEDGLFDSKNDDSTQTDRANTKSRARPRIEMLRKANSNSKQQKDLLISILDDTDDIDQIEYFDDDEIYSKDTEETKQKSLNASTRSLSSVNSLDFGKNPTTTTNETNISNKPQENAAFELLRMFSIKSANTWWRWSSAKDLSTPNELNLKSLPNKNEGVNSLIEIEMNPIGTPQVSDLQRDFKQLLKQKTMQKLNSTSYFDDPDEAEAGYVNKLNCNEIYTVKESSDTLRSIAARYGTTPTEIKVLNKLTHDYVFVGQMLMIPLIESAKIES